MADDTGTRFGRYTADRLLGTGAFATVWLARDEALDAPVAVKVLAENWAHDADVRRRFADEARILRRLESDRIVRIYDVAELGDGRPYFVMEYADRPDLSARIGERVKEGQFGVDEALDTALAIADALAVAHALDVVHRDLKPSNVLFRSVGTHLGDARDERMILADFGIARSLLGGRATTIAAGTPFYMAPEQSEGRSDKRSDVYAAAAILYEQLSGRVPFPFDSIGALLRAQITTDPERLDTLRNDVSKELADVVARGLAREPEDRYEDAAAWAAALRAARAGQPAAAAASDAPPETARSMAETRLGASAGAAGAAAAAAVGAAAGAVAGADAAGAAVSGGSAGTPPQVPGTGGGGGAGGGASGGGGAGAGGGGGGARSGGSSRRKRRTMAVAALTALVLAIAGIAVATNNSGSSKQAASNGGGGANPYRILLERARSTGPNSFTPPMVDPRIKLPHPTLKIPEIPVNLPGAPHFPIPSINQSVQTGSIPGLYGGTRQISVCNGEGIISFLDQHEDKAEAWAKTEGIVRTGIGDFIHSLTPLILRSDTTVLNHGFFNGRATPHVSILQAGTAVLVDRFGVPRAKCFCGNPLLGVKDIPVPSAGQRTSYVGAPWPTFNPRTVIAILPAPQPIVKFVIIDVIKKVVIVRPAGTTGDEDTPGVLPGGVSTTTAAPTTTTPPTTTPPIQIVDISKDGTPFASSVAPGTTFTEALAFDNNFATSWFSAGAAEGENSTLMWTAQASHRITSIRLTGNSQNSNPSFRSGFGFNGATIAVQNISGQTVFTQDVSFAPSDDPNATVNPNVVGVKIIITFHHHQNPQCGGLSEVTVMGA